MSKFMGKAVWVVAGAVLGSLAWAGEEPSAAFNRCMDASGGVTASVLECIQDETEQQDARLNWVYKVLSRQLSAERRQELLVAQRLWIKYRDANCGFYLDPEGGSMAAIMASDCVMQMTLQRASELQGFVEPE